MPIVGLDANSWEVRVLKICPFRGSNSGREQLFSILNLALNRATQWILNIGEEGDLMGKTYYADLRAFLEDLEGRGMLYRWQRKVNKDTELMPLMRLQYRGLSDEARRAFLYENVTDTQDSSQQTLASASSSFINGFH